MLRGSIFNSQYGHAKDLAKYIPEKMNFDESAQHVVSAIQKPDPLSMVSSGQL